MTDYVVAECTNPACRLRFPRAAAESIMHCPRCGGRLDTIRPYSVPTAFRPEQSMPPRRVIAVLDNIRSTHNVGNMLRTADGAGLTAVYLCGTTATPQHPRVAKTALGAQDSVRWRYFANIRDALAVLLEDGYAIYALEGVAGVTDLTSLVDLPPAVALIVGHELAGVDPALLAAADRIVAIPMRGVKESLNVAVAFGIACYTLTR